MSQRVDFAFGAPDRFRQAAATLSKLYRRHQRTVVYCPDRKRSLLLSKRLWGIEPSEFVAHELIDHPDQALQSPARLYIAESGLEVLASEFADIWLLNMDQQCPPGWAHFQRILEIVSVNEQDRQLARRRWQQYKEHGAALKATQL